MQITDGYIQGSIVTLDVGDTLNGVLIDDSIVYAKEGAGTLTGCAMNNTVIHLPGESLGEYDPMLVKPQAGR